MLTELHVHTTYSRGTKIIAEGLSTPEQIVRYAKRIGLGAIAITDHDNINGAKKALKLQKKYDIIVIPGEEISTKDGHVLALGINELIKPRLSLDETLDIIHEQGGIGIAAHPFDVAKRGLGKLAKRCDAVEVFNALNLERIGNFKCERFAKKNKLPMVAGSDTHIVYTMGYGLTKIEANSIDSVLKAIEKGRTKLICRYVPTKIVMNWTVQRLKMSYAYTIDYMNKNYSWPKRTVGKKLIGLVRTSPGEIDYFFKLLGYVTLGSVIVYSGIREIVGV